MVDSPDSGSNFIVRLIEKHQKEHPHLPIRLRFPPEPNGYLHIGHAKSICLNFGLAQRYQGRCHLRFDDTNPDKEEVEYTHAIQDIVQWLGFNWQDLDNPHIQHLYYASDYFQTLYDMALSLIDAGLAYVDSQSAEDIKKHRGNLQTPGVDSPYRMRSAAENRSLFIAMHAGNFAEGTHVLRARIDMQSPNMNMRDPIMYRIKHSYHPHTQNTWCIYPMYDYTHGISDALEGITHSLCTLEFADHRPLYEWFLEKLQNIGYFKDQILPQQYEFARLNLEYSLTSKRQILQLIEHNHVDSWDDPRLSTLSGLRRRGYTPESITLFCERIGVAKSDSWVEYYTLEQCLREDLEHKAPRLNAIIDPVRLVIENFPPDALEPCQAPVHPQQPNLAMRQFTFSNTLWVERDDIRTEVQAGFFRLAPGQKVRLRYAFVIECTRVECDVQGNIQTVYAQYFEDSKSGTAGSNAYKVKGNIHWVNAKDAYDIYIDTFKHLFAHPQPATLGEDMMQYLQTDSKKRHHAYIERSHMTDAIVHAAPKAQAEHMPNSIKHVQFERLGYFCVDVQSSQAANRLTFNHITGLKDAAKHK